MCFLMVLDYVAFWATYVFLFSLDFNVFVGIHMHLPIKGFFSREFYLFVFSMCPQHEHNLLLTFPLPPRPHFRHVFSTQFPSISFTPDIS